MLRYVSIMLVTLAGLALLSGCATRQSGQSKTKGSTMTEKQLPTGVARQFSYGYWLNGYRKSPEDASPDILCVETGHYGFMLDMGDLNNPRFGTLDDDVDYAGALASGARRMAPLPSAELELEVEVDGKIYKAVTCRAGRDTGERRLKSARLWESGRIAQHFDLLDLRFEDEVGNPLGCYGTLDLVGWPDSLTLTAELTPSAVYSDGPCQGVAGNGLCIIEKPLDVPHSPELEPENLTLECWINIPEVLDSSIYGWLVCKNGNEWGTGNYGFMFKNGATAVLNNVGGRDKQHMIKQRGHLEKGKWHHLALTYDGTTMRYYVNGAEHGNKAIEEKRVPGNGILRIGKRADGNFGVVNGLYDQVRVWSRALPAKEIAEHARQPEELASRDGLVLDRSFDEGVKFEPPVWTDAELRLRLKTAQNDWHAEKRVAGSWNAGDKQQLSLTCDSNSVHVADREIAIQVSTPDGQTFPVCFDETKNCYVAQVKGLKRSFPGGYVKITDYDEFDILLDCADDAAMPVPFLLDFYGPANITGLVPILCHPDGTPTGVPVQLSKNWHYGPTGAYLRAYTLVPVEPGQNHFRLRIPYGFYGTLPSASHSQLCLVGYGGNGRWDQLALACGGESITFDADMSLTNVAVCDVRTPLGRHGRDGNTWGWTEAGWGGDWLGVYGGADWKLTFSELKVAYLSHGPCLSDVLYKGAYGSEQDVLVDARIQNPRTDDYGRTFQKLNYRFQRETAAANSYLLRRHARAFDSLVAYGNAEGLIAEKRVIDDLKKGDLLVPPTELTSPGPWWVAFPERGGKPTGYVSLIIRDYEASFDGNISRNPFLMVRVESRKENTAKLETWFVPPPGVKTYKPGDRVALDTEWVHLVTEADNYGGSNDAYRRHLVENPRSWKTTYREVTGNSLGITVDGGELRRKLPIVIQAQAPEVSVAIQGGIGHVPIRFEGLKTADGYAIYELVNREEQKLDQSVHGNDFWQTDHDAGSDSYKMTFNLPLDGRETSRWVLRRR